MKQLIARPNISGNIDSKAFDDYQKLGKILYELESKKLSTATVSIINREIEALNAIVDIDISLVKAIKEKENLILHLVKTKHNIVPKNYYSKLWMTLGMSAFGIPMGLVFGLSIGNLGMMGIGIPIGLAIGSLLGSVMDKKAFDEGRQLDF